MLRSELRHGTTLDREEAAWESLGTDWPDVANVDPKTPPPGWHWRANPARPGTGHAYDAHGALQCALRCGTFGGRAAGKIPGFLRTAERKLAETGTLADADRGLENSVAALLEASFQAAYDRDVANVARLFAVAEPAEAAPFLDLLARLLDDGAFYAAAAARAKASAERHLRDRASRAADLLS